MAIQVNKVKKLNPVLDEEDQIAHILASLPREYINVVEQVKTDRRLGSTLITMDEVKKRIKERYMQLKREQGWSEDEMALNMNSSNNQNQNNKKGKRKSSSKEGATIVEYLGTRRLIVGTLRIRKRNIRKTRRRSKKINQRLNVSGVESLVIMQMNARMTRIQVGRTNMSL